MKNLQARLDLLLDRIDSPKFQSNDGLGNEIGFWIFDYPANQELLVREHINYMADKLKKRGKQFEVINLFQVIIDMLQSRNLLERTFIITISRNVAQRAGNCDIFLEPYELRKFGALEFSKIQEIYEMGYRYGLTETARIEKILNKKAG